MPSLRPPFSNPGLLWSVYHQGNQELKVQTALAVAAILVLILAAGAILLTRTSQEVSSSTTSALGLQLSVSLSSSQVKHGSSVKVTTDLSNVLSGPINLTGASRWPLPGLSLSACGRGILPYGISVMSGYYDKQNYSLGAPLSVFGPPPYTCFNPDLYNAAYYAFDGHSDVATAPGWGTLKMNFTLTTSGYWVQDASGSSTFRNFAPGVYTIACGDEWGDLVFVRFSVGTT